MTDNANTTFLMRCLPFRSDQPAVLHLQNPRGEVIDAAVVGDDQNAALVVQDVILDEGHNAMAGVSVQRCRGFIHDQDVRFRGDGAGDRDALLLASAQLHRRQIGAAFESHDLQIFLGFLRSPRPSSLA